MNLGLIAFVCCFSLAFGSIFDSWKAHIHKFALKFANKGDQVNREKIWRENVDTINKHNEEYERGVHTYRLGVNKYTHLSRDEFLAKHTGYKRANLVGSVDTQSKITPMIGRGVNLPTSVDWRNTNLTGPLKEQGKCGDCWAFSVIDALEGQQSKKMGYYVKLSPQHLTNCLKTTAGCNGGDTYRAIQEILTTSSKEVYTEASYPFTSGTTGKEGGCSTTNKEAGAKITSIAKGWDVTTVDGTTYTGGIYVNETWLTDAVANVGPISACLYTSDKFSSYKGGIFSESECSVTVFRASNHCVSVVGYGTDATTGKNYWILRNSWGDGWGEKGHMRLLKDSGNQLCIASLALYPVVA